ncbi:hypothetical protein VTK26DRAFT_8761 [Humicola hyalothermophila]
MPRTTILPTPTSSSDIKGQDGTSMASLQMAFELPPPAVTGGTSYPTQPSETVKSRRRASTINEPAKDQFALPPPPTRSRRIIQMQPPRGDAGTGSPASSSKAGSKGGAGAGSTPAVAGAKRKQPSATSAAGRKIARKTAHSLIERRRRSKMNEEFAVLKSLIPACTGEMHKLAILQASIEYVRYLEDCVAKLKAQCGPGAKCLDTESTAAQSGLPSPLLAEMKGTDRSYPATMNPCSPDTDMTSSSGAPSPDFTPTAASSKQPSVSPALRPEAARNRHPSHSSVSSEYQHYGYTTPSTTSPIFGPQGYAEGHYSHSAYGSALTSPALPPQRDMDHEATAALLMLNKIDRRASSGTAAGRGISVRDLLSG